MLAEALGGDTLLLREPGGTPAGERVRELLTDPAVELEPMAELMLFLAARSQLCDTVIRPALAAGRTVVCDRFSDSTIAYQGDGRGLGPDRVGDLCEAATGGLWPDLTVLISLEPESALARRASRADDRFEAEGPEFHLRVAAGYERIAAEGAPRVRKVDGSAHAEAIHAQILELVREQSPEPASAGGA